MEFGSFLKELREQSGLTMAEIHLLCGITNSRLNREENGKRTLKADEIKKLAPSHIILSPGPGYPKDAGICEAVIKELAGQFPILGICLGHQAICEVYGATIAHAIKLMHGKKSDIIVDTDKKIFNGLPKVVEGARYHSLIAKRDTVPDTLEVIAEDRDGEVMGVKHKDFELYGLQFHPESILTSHGMEMIKNFITLCK